jgi:hypothetical protein
VQVEFWDFTIFGRTYTTWPIFNIADVSVSLGFLIILLFHNKIFNTGELSPAGGDEQSTPVDGGYPAQLNNGSSLKNTSIQDPVLPDTLTENSQIEDTKENAVPGPGRTGEIKN